METEWKRALDFAEYAEALKIRTTQILALKAGGDEPTIVVYTPELDEADLDPNTPLYIARVERDADRILMVVGEPILTEFDWSDLEAEIERKLREQFDDPA